MAEPIRFGHCFAAQLHLNRSAATDEVHDDGDQCEQQQQVNQETADVKEEKPAQPQKNQYYR
jgi:hypothetical protein